MDNPKKPKRNGIVIIIISSITAIVIALIQFHGLDTYKKVSGPSAKLFLLSGTIVDGDTNKGVGLAQIQIVGHTENGISEGNGNFRIYVTVDTSDEKNKEIRIRVNKRSYKELDQSATLPAESLVLPLNKE